MPAAQNVVPVAVVTGAGRGFGKEIARRLAGRGYTVLVGDIDSQAAADTATEIGGGALPFAMDVRNADAHRAAAAAAAEQGRLDVWVNNAGVMRTVKTWQHPDDDVRLMVDVNLLGVIWGSRAAVEAMSRAPGGSKHIINLGSMSALAPVPGLTVYSATKHAVLGFSGALHGDLLQAGLPITVQCLCPDGADTGLLREQAQEKESAIIWSAPRILSPEEVADRALSMLDTGRLLEMMPRSRGWQIRVLALFPRAGLRIANVFQRVGERRRARESRA
jgi:NAD(P)-dependent dehydrogenase (short-subunit alcohol dehydrogenase family)